MKYLQTIDGICFRTDKIVYMKHDKKTIIMFLEGISRDFQFSFPTAEMAETAYFEIKNDILYEARRRDQTYG